MRFALAIPIPTDYARHVEAFRQARADWAGKQNGIAPHVTIKGPVPFERESETFETVEEITRQTSPFSIQLIGPAIFEEEAVLHLGVDSPGWHALHRTLVDALAARAGATLHPFEVVGWTPHMTILFGLTPESLAERSRILDETDRELSPYPAFKVDAITLYRQASLGSIWLPFRDFRLRGIESIDR